MILLILLQVIIKSVSKTDEFIKTLPQAIVPKDYGGLAPIMSKTNGKFCVNIMEFYFEKYYFIFTEILKQKLLDNRDYFLDEEKLRNGNVKDEVDTTIGENDKDNIHSFKNLSID